MVCSSRRYCVTLLLNDDYKGIIKAAAIIKNGGLVAFPTETVYGLGAAATSNQAVKKIYAAKGRPSDNPLIVHIASLKQLERVAEKISDYAYRLAERFWPGPLSLILPRASEIPQVVSSGYPTVAVRMPDHKVALNLIDAAGVPIAAPSANRSGRPSPTSYRHVLEDLTGKIDAVIKSDSCSIGIESTVLDLTSSLPVILRPGGISREELEAVLGIPVYLAGSKRKRFTTLAPGMKYRHYSPRAPLILFTGPQKRRRLIIDSIINYYHKRCFKIGLLNPVSPNAPLARESLEALAARLYHDLRDMDNRGVDLILAEELTVNGLGLALMNRLKKAATRVLKVK